ncbi:unnamed protein product [Adineta ricciae]|uniref:RanBP2-type domain-containing protein n=1 Tax=Adineta ricciae TaxID=249248 RepID=A0A813TC19_ADIRI|nr:unnamed protein product [Adineta ricciae]
MENNFSSVPKQDQQSFKSSSPSTLSKTADNNTSTLRTKATEALYSNQPVDDYKEHPELAQDPSSTQGDRHFSPTTCVQNWKCRECGYINDEKNISCDTCDTEKPIYPCLEIPYSNSDEYGELSSFGDRDYSSQVSETVYDRSGLSSPSSIRRKTSRSDRSSSSSDQEAQDSMPTSTTREKLRSSSDKHSYNLNTKANEKPHSEKTYAVSSNSSALTSDFIYPKSHSTYEFAPSENFEPVRAPIPTTPGLPVHTQSTFVRNYVLDDKASPKNAPLFVSRSNLQVKSDTNLYPDKSQLSSSTTRAHRDNNALTAHTMICKTSNSSNLNVVYIPDLPVNIHEPKVLEDMLRSCLEDRHKQKVVDVECNTLLGVGIVHLPSKEEKDHLLNTVIYAMIEPSSKATVSFVDKLDLVSYVVISNNENNGYPTGEEIQRQWMQVYKPKSPPKCEQLSALFPNIFRVTTHSLDELISAMSTRVLIINNNSANVYFRADCCFYEDLPRAMNQEKLVQAVRQQITDEYMAEEYMHIQRHKTGGIAVIISSGRARIWSLREFIESNGKKFNKKNNLACRLKIPNVPRRLSIESIQNHKVFANCVVHATRKNDDIVLELSDRNVFDKCIDQAAFCVHNHPLRIEAHQATSKPEDSDIDDDTWYETDMRDYTKANIMQFVPNHEHPIFRYKWNSEAFLKQFRRWTSKQHDRSVGPDPVKYEDLCNLKRHLLRMTVMLNTIGVVTRGFYRVEDKEIKLISNRLKTVVYNHKSKLHHKKTILWSQATTFPCPQTIVKVVQRDCLLVYKELVSKGLRPVLLNMANAYNPGGGYRQGDGAQEESLFRRSNYYQSLDAELDGDKPSARYRYDSNGALEQLAPSDALYPMDKYGAIYTSGLTVFRQPEEVGYGYMPIPMYDVCSIAMAAYRDPKIEHNLLAAKYSLGTRKKIENIFAIAHHNKHDSLVLSAFGCGAFHNPPRHIAAIFKSVIEQYAGYFKCIYFAIIDDHNAGSSLNPQGNYSPFQTIFNDAKFEPKKNFMTGMMIGPWRIINEITTTTKSEVTLDDVEICQSKLCHFGGGCKELTNTQHCQEYSHPALCPYTNNETSCKENQDAQHRILYQHRRLCSEGGECKLVDDDQTHRNKYEHPVFCRDGGACENLDRDHLKSYRHVPFCKDRLECLDYILKSKEHCHDFRHCMPMCRYGKFCIRFHDEKHLQEEKHPFNQPCPFTPYYCPKYNEFSQAADKKSLKIDVQKHCLQLSHVCEWGRLCKDTSEQHSKSTIHVPRHMCPYDNRCTKTNQDDHLNTFSHTGILDIRPMCAHRRDICRNKGKSDHMKQFRHYGNYDFSGVINYFGQNKSIDFVENQKHMMEAINSYFEHNKITRSVPEEIERFVKALQPVHRCSKVIFESILVHGHVMSSKHMEHLKQPKFAAQAAQEHRDVRTILDRHGAARSCAKEYIQAIIALEYSKYSKKHPISLPMEVPPISSSMLRSSILPTSDSQESNETIQKTERCLRAIIGKKEIDTIRRCAVDIATASWNLHNAPAGIQYEKDKQLGTNKHVFGILGPHCGHYYGDIVLVFKAEVMLHPDANFTHQAATSYLSGKTYSQRPWVRDPGSDSRKRTMCFHRSKMHCSVSNYEHVAAAELIAITSEHQKKSSINCDDILHRWLSVDSHEVFEAHLPQLIPLDYIEKVYIPESLFYSLSQKAQECAKRTFCHGLHLTNHRVDVSPNDMRALDKNRMKYQNFIIKELVTNIEKRMKHPTYLYGTLITLVPTKFTDYIVLPITINKAYYQYRRTHKNHSNADDIYIYWQAMHGDMILALSDEHIESKRSEKNTQYLVCYIAPRPSLKTATYYEAYSYLSDDDPYRHKVILASSECVAKSNTFYRGCNSEDFLTFCLKLDKKTGQVTLSHAGANGIYCHNTITYQFSKQHLDLNKLRYVHVSARSQKVPIRNLVITFKPISDLHPSFDKNFRPEGDVSSNDAHSHSHDKPPPHRFDGPSRDESPSFLNKAGNAIKGAVDYLRRNDKERKPCPEAVNCLLQGSSAHTEEFFHPCRYAELCNNKDKEPHLTHESRRVTQCQLNISCSKLDNPAHRAAYRHDGYPDFLIPCRDSSKCQDSTFQHRKKYSHGEKIDLKLGYNDEKNSSQPSSGGADRATEDQMSSFGEGGRENVQKNPCLNESNCRAQNDGHHYSGYSHENRQPIPCRYANNCRDKDDPQHSAKYSHPNDHRPYDASASNQGKIHCRHGNDCWDKNDPNHCSKYFHPSARGSEKIQCRYGNDCRDKNDPRHCSKYSHPFARSNEQIQCRYGNDCRDKNDPRHCAKYSHPHRR